MAKSTIHVHQSEVRKRDPENHPAIIVRSYKGSLHARKVDILGADGSVVASLVHSDEPDRCGARVWLTTEAPLVIDGQPA